MASASAGAFPSPSPSPSLGVGYGVSWDRVVAAAGAAVASALITNPMDVVKTRIQAQSAQKARGLVDLSGCGIYNNSNNNTNTTGITSSSSSSSACSSKLHEGGPMKSSSSSSSSCSSGSGSRPVVGATTGGVNGFNGVRNLTCGCVYTTPHPSLQVARVVGSVNGKLRRSGHGAQAQAMQSIPRQCQVLYQGTLDAARKIVRREGFSTLWRGTGPALVMAVPQVGIYLPTYEWLKKTLEQSQTLSDGNNDGGSILPVLLAGTTARALAVLITSPLERARTRAQAFTASASASATNKVNGGRKGKGGLRCLSHEVFGVAAKGGSAGIGNLWKGTVATLARDIPFSGIYWVTLETIRNRINRNTKQPGEGGGEVKNIIMNNNSSFGGGDHPSAGHGSSSATTNNTLRDVALVNLVAGTSAGVVAASLTTPLDVVKTRVQVDLDNANAKGKNNNNAVRGLRQIAQMLREIVSQEGAKNLFAGAGARAARAAPSCAIVLTSYEVLKTVLNKNF